MLTVLTKYLNGGQAGREVLFEATMVEFKRGDGLVINCGERSQHFAVSENDDDLRDVFVMNSEGQTVARYTL